MLAFLKKRPVADTTPLDKEILKCSLEYKRNEKSI
jgi:hypothetical protein